MSPKAQDFGEPWVPASDMVRGADEEEIWYRQLLDRHEKLVALDGGHDSDRVLDRIASCVSALKGCPDPEAFVAAVKKSLDRRTHHEGLLHPFPSKVLYDFKRDPALAWLRERS